MINHRQVGFEAGERQAFGGSEITVSDWCSDCFQSNRVIRYRFVAAQFGRLTVSFTCHTDRLTSLSIITQLARRLGQLAASHRLNTEVTDRN